MASINLTKGGSLDLEKRLQTARLELSWSKNTYGGAPFDADVSAAVLTGEGAAQKFIGDDYFVFYNNKASPDGAVQHQGDKRDGGTEVLNIKLSALPPTTSEVAIILTIHEGEQRGQDWSKLGAVASLFDEDSGTLLARYDLGADFAGKISVQPVSFYRKPNGAWTFKALGVGYDFGLQPFVERWGR